MTPISPSPRPNFLQSINMRLLVAGALLGGVVVQSLQVSSPRQCTDAYQRQSCAAQSQHCLLCAFDSGTQPSCVSLTTKSEAIAYCNQRDPSGSLSGSSGLGLLGNLGGLGIGNDLNLGLNNGLGGLQSNSECNFGGLCSNGAPCALCNLNTGQRALCSDPGNPNRDFCNSPQFSGICSCGTVEQVPQVAIDQTVQQQTTPAVDNSIQISYIEPLVPLQDFQTEPLTTIPDDPPPPDDSSSSTTTTDQPDYAAFMVPRGLTRDHIRGENF